MFFNFNSPQHEDIFAKICSMFYKNVLRKKQASYAVKGLYKNYDVRFHRQENRKFNFKTLKVFLLAAINAIILTALLLLNLYTVLLLRFMIKEDN